MEMSTLSCASFMGIHPECRQAMGFKLREKRCEYYGKFFVKCVYVVGNELLDAQHKALKNGTT
jgi:hypothetical protein